MTDDFGRRLTERVEAATPDTLTPYDDVLARRDRRRTRRRVGGVAAVVVAVGAVGVAAVLAGGTSDERGDAPVATRPASPTGPALVVPSGGTDGPPPAIVVRGNGPQVDAWQGSYCWGNGCADMVSPAWNELPALGASDTVEAGFMDPEATWTASLAGRRRCAGYPVQLAPTGAGTVELTPSGPAGDYRLDRSASARRCRRRSAPAAPGTRRTGDVRPGWPSTWLLGP